MNKVEFIDMLRRHISEVEDPGFINDTVSYYQDYIDTAIRKGRTEEDVLKELGDPRHIAKSIVASRDDSGIYGSKSADQNRSEGSYEYGRSGDDSYGNDSYGNDRSNDAGAGKYAIYDGKFHVRLRNGNDLGIPLGLVKAGAVATGILLVVGISSVAAALIPVACIGLLALLVYRFFKDNF